jgi:hypothetical protein
MESSDDSEREANKESKASIVPGKSWQASRARA